jgi:hypothetical protein
MAYLRKDEEKVEISYSLDKVWDAMPKSISSLGWHAEQIDEQTHRMKIKTTAGPMSWSSMIFIEAVSTGDNTTRVTASSETPVTMITSIVDFRQGKRRILHFFEELAKQMSSQA